MHLQVRGGLLLLLDLSADLLCLRDQLFRLLELSGHGDSLDRRWQVPQGYIGRGMCSRAVLVPTHLNELLDQQELVPILGNCIHKRRSLLQKRAQRLGRFGRQRRLLRRERAGGCGRLQL